MNAGTVEVTVVADTSQLSDALDKVENKAQTSANVMSGTLAPAADKVDAAFSRADAEAKRFKADLHDLGLKTKQVNNEMEKTPKAAGAMAGALKTVAMSFRSMALAYVGAQGALMFIRQMGDSMERLAGKNSDIDKFATSLQSAGRVWDHFIDNVTIGAAKAANAIAGMFSSKAQQDAEAYAEQLAKIAKLTGITAEQIEKLISDSKRLNQSQVANLKAAADKMGFVEPGRSQSSPASAPGAFKPKPLTAEQTQKATADKALEAEVRRLDLVARANDDARAQELSKQEQFTNDRIALEEKYWAEYERLAKANRATSNIMYTQEMADAVAVYDRKAALNQATLDSAISAMEAVAEENLAFNATEEEAEAKKEAEWQRRHLERQLAVSEAYKKGIIGLEAYIAAIGQLETNAANHAIEVDKAKSDQQIANAAMVMNAVGSILGSMASMMDQNNKKEFEAGKVLRYGQAIINTAAGVTQALGSSPPPLNFVMAAAVAAAGAAQIAVIARQQYKSPSSGGGGSLAAPSASGSSNTGSPAPVARNVTQVNLTLMGESGYSADQVRGLVSMLNGAAGDNMNINVSNR